VGSTSSRAAKGQGVQVAPAAYKDVAGARGSRERELARPRSPRLFLRKDRRLAESDLVGEVLGWTANDPAGIYLLRGTTVR
jgi:hypothetical protein